VRRAFFLEKGAGPRKKKSEGWPGEDGGKHMWITVHVKAEKCH